MVTKTLTGPNGLRLVLDSAEIFPADPGQGTPAMVYRGNASATYWCALGEGELMDPRCEMVALTASQSNWLDAQESAVDAFLKENDPA
jgi:hypothetical protein